MLDPADAPAAGGAGLLVRVALLGLLFVVIVRTAWLCDDAYISLRTVDNFTNGYGLRWNVAERVQSYTHPLWVLLLAAASSVSGELFRTTLGLSITLAILAVALFLFRHARMTWSAAVGGLALLLSPAFVAYCTSGLEVALSLLLFALFALVYFQPGPSETRSFWLSAVAAFALTTRLDYAWIYAPPLAYSLYSTRRSAHFGRHLRAGTIGLAPLAAWLLFALVYYGFWYPNSAPAKLATGLTLVDYAAQGARYYLDSLLRDPLTTLTIAAALGLTWSRARGASRALAIGVFAYLAYVLLIGGDFMRGRFLALPLFASLCLAARPELGFVARRRSLSIGVPALVVLLGVVMPRAPVFSGPTHGGEEARPEYKGHFGIADERWIYFRQYGLLNTQPMSQKLGADVDALRVLQAADSTHLKIVWAAGRSGLMGGPRLHLVEAYALTDPLLARLPMRVGASWRIGHFRRMLPAGYLRSLALGRNEITDPRIGAFYDRVRSVTRGPLWDRRRWIDIVNFNLHRYDHLVRGHRDYDVVTNEEYVAVFEHIGAAAGPTIRWESALAYIAMRNLESAKQALRLLFELPQQYRYGYVAPDYTLEVVRHALDHDKRGHTAFAEELLLFMVELEPERMELHAALGAMNLNAGKLEAARRHFEAAARLGDQQAREVLEQLRDVSGD
jgi:arabinofuranosyltransferase